MSTCVHEILSDIQSLEPMPHVALKVLELSSSPDVIPRDLIDVIQTDAAMTAKVLRLTNSSYYGFRREIASLDEAGNLLGVGTLVNLVLTSCASRYFRKHGRGDAGAACEMWVRSVSNALAATLLARLQGGVSAGRAYTAGLLQDIGQLVLQRYMKREQETIQAEIAAGAALLEAETRVFGMHHAEVGARLSARWSFPEVLVDTIRFHHEPEKARIDPLLTCFVHLGGEITETLRARSNVAGVAGAEAVAGDPAPTHILAECALERTGFDRHGLDSLAEVLALELDKAREFVEAV